MKRIFSSIILWIVMLSAHAQNSIAINTTGNVADPSAILDISSTDKGMLIPRMTSMERESIAAPAHGLLVFDVTTNSFWFYSGGWQQIAGGGGLNGPAAGDLAGNYPAPSVVKLQNLPLAPDVPGDKQVLKWDAAANNWKGRNDSLFLPYNVSALNAGALFGITNTDNSPGAISVLGKRGNGSGLSPATTMGVWGDNSTGMGVLGTSQDGVGTYGFSQNNNGVYGYTTNAAHAGVVGANAADNGVGVLGEIGQAGIGVLGKGKGQMSVAGRFENTASDNQVMALDARNLGKGPAASFWTNNASNSTATVLVTSMNPGHGVFSMHGDFGTDNSAVHAWHLGTGRGLYAKSDKGDAARIEIDKFDNHEKALHASTLGNGSAGFFQKAYVFGESEGDAAVLIDNYSRSVGLKVKSYLAAQQTAAIDVEYGGYAYAVNIASLKGGLRSISEHENSLAVFAQNTADEGTAIQGIANGFSAVGVHGSANGSFGNGVLGTTSSGLGIGVKGENNSDLYAAVTGENTGGGGGVRGVNKSSFGYGVIGECGNEHGIAGHFRSSNPLSQISPAIWAHITSLSSGVEITVVNEQNENDALFVRHDGTGAIARFQNADYEDIVIAQNGNYITPGTIVVRNNKGIVRSSTSTQLRMATASVQLTHFDMPIGAIVTQTVTFAQSFNAAPVVSVGNIQAGHTGPCDKMVVQVKNVTTTGCTVTMYNASVSGTPDVSGTWNLTILGAE